MSIVSHDLVLFLGRFHPLLVHLPIGGLVLLGILEVLAKFPRFKGVAQNNRLILGLVAAASVTTASLGWMLLKQAATTRSCCRGTNGPASPSPRPARWPGC